MSLKQQVLEESGESLDPRSETIRGPGKFEGEPWYTLHFYDRMMNGDGEEIGGEGEAISVFILDAEDKRDIPELRDVYAVALWESDQGFANLEEFEDEADLEAYREKVGAAYGEDEGEEGD